MRRIIFPVVLLCATIIVLVVIAWMPNYEEIIIQRNLRHVELWKELNTINSSRFIRHKAPILNNQQLNSIALLIDASTFTNPSRKLKFLVFGLGYDSVYWRKVNGNGVTIFFEHHQEWIDQVEQKIFAESKFELESRYEIALVNYRANLSEREKFFENPYLIRVPAHMENYCYDLILVDSPEGFDPLHKNGRMESSYFALKNAERCLGQGIMQVVYVFLHDVQRIGESEIAKEYFDRFTQILEIDDPFGQLKGWRMTARDFINI
jgi:hypothetical protein